MDSYDAIIVDEEVQYLKDIVPVLSQIRLNGNKLKVYAESDPYKSLEMIKKRVFSLVFLDLNFQRDDIDGANLYCRIRKIDKHLPIAILSAFCHDEYWLKKVRDIKRRLKEKPLEIDKPLPILGTTEFDGLQERIKSKANEYHWKPFTLTFDQAKGMRRLEIRRIQEIVSEKHKEWIDNKINLLRANWIMICGGLRVVKWSRNPDKYPTNEVLRNTGERFNRIPFVFSEPLLIEESNWNTTKYSDRFDDRYPTIRLYIGNSEKQTEVVADFDTGLNAFVFNYDDLIKRNIINEKDFFFKNAERGCHLGERFVYFRETMKITMIDENDLSRTRSYNVYLVKEWNKSPFRIVNKRRCALVGRNIFWKFPLKVELYGGRNICQKTRFFAITRRKMTEVS